MTDHINTFNFTVKRGMGLAIGNFMRQLAILKSASWKIIALDIGAPSETYGLRDSTFTRLEALKASLTVDPKMDNSKIELDIPILCTFKKTPNKVYKCDHFTINGLDHLNIQTLHAVLIYSKGVRTYEENIAAVRNLTESHQTLNLGVIPTTHSEVTHFSYKVEPLNLSEETLLIKSTRGSVNSSINEIEDIYTTLKGGMNNG